MDAMILAAGFGTRMRRENNAPPKPLTMLGKQSLIRWMLTHLVAAQCRRIVINLHFGADAIRMHLADWHEAELIFTYEAGAPLETGGGVKAARQFLRGTHFLVANCDSFWHDGDDELTNLIAGFDARRMDARLMLASGGDDFAGDKNIRLTRGHGFTFAGVQILQRSLFDDTPDGAFSLNLLYDRAIARARAFGYVMAADWLHVGTPEQLAMAQNMLREFSPRD